MLVRCKSKISPSIPCLTLQKEVSSLMLPLSAPMSGSVHCTIECTGYCDKPARLPDDTDCACKVQYTVVTCRSCLVSQGGISQMCRSCDVSVDNKFAITCPREHAQGCQEAVCQKCSPVAQAAASTPNWQPHSKAARCTCPAWHLDGLANVLRLLYVRIHDSQLMV